jgi:cytochrome c-type biogenesis protein
MAEVNVSRWAVFRHGLAFVLGFSAVFVLLGFGAGLLGGLASLITGSRRILGYAGGVLLVVLGLHTMGVIRIPFLYYDTRKQVQPRPELGYVGSAFMGIVFAAGWSPCIGPILGLVLTLAGNTGSAGRGTVLLVAYSLGLGMPFLLAALLLERMTGLLRRFRKHLHAVELIGGALMVIVGGLLLTNSLQIASQLAALPDLSYDLEEWIAVTYSVGIDNISIPLAALAGLISFMSPCVFPLIPAYIGYLTAQAAGAASVPVTAGSG